MIEGLKIKVTAAELQQHCQDRATYHAGRADSKEAELPSLREALEKIKATGGRAADTLARMSGKSETCHLDPDDPLGALENDIRDHRNKALVFGFFASHLFDEDYVLQEVDLIRLEILKRW